MKLNWNFLGGGVQNKKPSIGGSMDVFWNYRIANLHAKKHNFANKTQSVMFFFTIRRLTRWLNMCKLGLGFYLRITRKRTQQSVQKLPIPKFKGRMEMSFQIFI